MAKKTILLIEDDPKTEASIREALGKEYSLETAPGATAASAILARKTPDLIIIDFDLKREDGMQVFRSLGSSARTIMLSASGSIPLAVSAAKSGVAEFLRKPIDADRLRGAVERNILKPADKLRLVMGLEWLRGESPKLNEMFAAIQKSLRENVDIVLVGEQGTPLEKVAELIHYNGPKKGRKFIRMDLTSFRPENLEAHFWANIHELMAIPSPASIQNEEERCGTLYLENLENVSEQFKLSIFNFFKERPAKIDKSIRAVIGIYDKKPIQELSIGGCGCIKIPSLRERKEDIPYLLGSYLARFSNEFGKNIRFISGEVLNFLAAYDYPGNYVELEKLMRAAVLRATSERLEIKGFPFNFGGLLHVSLKEGLREGLTLEEAKRRFEKGLYDVLLKKSEEQRSAVARFLDIPRTTLTERLEDLLG